MKEPDRLTDLIKRFQTGDCQAAEDLFAHYSKKLSRLAGRHLSNRLASRESDEDVVQSALRTFFRRNREGRFRIDTSAELWRLLVKITIRKAQTKGRYHTAGVRNVRAEMSRQPDGWLADAAAGEPGPDEALALVDQIEMLLKGLPREYGDILHMLMEKRSKSDIARELGISRVTVHRVAGLLRQRLENSLSTASLHR
jgi:DNA-directed RNA polymerase specialized sigma24 family protein